ncbi:formate dehydrogenase accessory protein FdhE [Paracoccus pacificus]|uniref:Protein FdhE homolog n=1 Tax=Paracoccus pacificus TaxID=1463598 RepID=A0ABW4R6Y6_9RHOB
MTTKLEPNPQLIGGVAKPPFAVTPDPQAEFTRRADRFDWLSRTGNLGSYLQFMAGIARAQATVAGALTAPAPLPEQRIELCRASRMPPLDRDVIARSDLMAKAVSLMIAALAELDMPEAARQALEALGQAGPEDRAWLIDNVMARAIPPDSIGPHMFAAAAVQVVMALHAQTLDAARLVPVQVGICPSCGGVPASSRVTERLGAEGVRYAFCATCATEWNEVRVKCLCCGSTKGISYRSVEDENATVKAEVCTECNSWVKILYHNKNPSLDPIADDVASLGLDLLMRDTGFRHGGFDPFIQGL